MNTFPLTRHLLLKDLWHQRVWLGLLWFLAISIPILTSFIGFNNAPNLNVDLAAAQGGFNFLLGLILLRVIQLDPPGRSVHFLATRPIPWNATLAGKTLFVGLFLLVPVWIVDLGTIYGVGIPYSFFETLLSTLESTLGFGLILSAVLVFALFTRSLASAFIAMFATVALLGLAAVLSRQSPDPGFHVVGRSSTLYVSESLEQSRALIFKLMCILGVSVVALVRYRSKEALKPAITLAAGLALTLSVSVLWPYDLSRFFSPTESATAELPGNISLSITQKEPHAGQYLTETSWNNIHMIGYVQPVLLGGVVPPYYAKLIDYHAQATLKSGRIITSGFDSLPMHGAVGGLSPAVLQQMAGFTPEIQNPPAVNSFELFSFLADDYGGEDLTGVNIKGTVTLEIRKAVLVKTLPLKSGEAMVFGRERCTVKDIVVTPTGLKFNLLTQELPVALPGNTPANNRDNPEFLSFLIQNKSKGDYMVLQNNYFSTSTDTNYYHVSLRGYEYSRPTFHNNWNAARAPIPADWADQAEIAFYTTESCGQIELPYELQDVALKR